MVHATLMNWVWPGNVATSQTFTHNNKHCISDGDDFVAVNDTITFGEEETEMEVLIFILYNSALEETEHFTVRIEAIEGVFPVAVVNSTATVNITDNDGNSE